MKILHYRLNNQNIHLFLATILSLFGFAFYVTLNFYLIIVIVLLILCILKKWKYLLFSIGFLILIIIIYKITVSSVVNKYIKGNYDVVKKTHFGFLIKHKTNNIFVFSKHELTTSHTIYLSGKAYPYHGNLEKYFLSLNVKSVMSYPFIKKIEINANFFDWLKLKLFSETNDEYRKIVSLLFFGEKNKLNKDFYSLTSSMNISYLFVISGFHIYLFHFLIKKIFFFLKPLNKDIISFSLALLYIMILGFPISALRAFIMLYIFVFNNYLKVIKLSKLEIMAISLTIIVLIYPYSIFSYSLPLTFISTFVILNIYSLEIKGYKKFLITPFIMFLFMLPFIIIFNGKINLISPFYSLIVTPLFVIFYLISFIFLPFKPFVNFLCKWFIFYIDKLSYINLQWEISSEIAWIFFSPYILFLISFIIYEIWNFYLVKKNI